MKICLSAKRTSWVLQFLEIKTSQYVGNENGFSKSKFINEGFVSLNSFCRFVCFFFHFYVLDKR